MIVQKKRAVLIYNTFKLSHRRFIIYTMCFRMLVRADQLYLINFSYVANR